MLVEQSSRSGAGENIENPENNSKFLFPNSELFEGYGKLAATFDNHDQVIDFQFKLDC